MIWRANGPCVKQWEQPLMRGGHIINFNMLALLFFCPQALIIRFLIALAQIALTIPKRTSVFIRSLMNKQKRMISNLWESLKKSTCPNQRLAGHVMESCSPLEQVHINSWHPPHLPLNSACVETIEIPVVWVACVAAATEAAGCNMSTCVCPWVCAHFSKMLCDACNTAIGWRSWLRNWDTKSVSWKCSFDEFKT